MKIRNPTLIKWLCFLGAIFIRLWIGTLSLRQRSLGMPSLPNEYRRRERIIVAFWHENILVPCHSYRHLNIHVLISEHTDGEIIAQVCKHLGYGSCRGSKTRGGMKALRDLIRASKSYDLAVTPDGPRGPRRHVEPGLIYLASKTGLPIAVMGVGHDRPWRLDTWDHFVVPRPFSKAVVIGAEPIYVPANASKAELEEIRLHVEKTLNEVTDYAERLASR